MNHIPESPPECEALLAEALEALAKFPAHPRDLKLDNIINWYWERARPAQKLIEAFLDPDSVTPST